MSSDHSPAKATSTPDTAPSPSSASKTSAAAAAAALNANAKSFVPGTRLSDGPGGAPTAASPSASQRVPRHANNATGLPPPPPIAPPLGMFVPPLLPGGLYGVSPLMPVMSPLAATAALAAQLSTPLKTPLGMPPPGGVFAGPGVARPPPGFGAPQASAGFQVSVGNAALAALRSTAPPKFACVLLVGLPKVGKTTAGRQVVQQLLDDKLQWSFFSGGDYIKDANPATRANPWQTTKDIFDALSQKIDDQLAKQATEPIRGLVIDKQCRGTEELYYLTSVLRAKGLSLNGVVGLECDDDTKLIERLENVEQGFREKLKYHRVVLTRVKETAKAVGLWHAVDALQPAAEVAHRLRSMILGCSSQAPAKQLVASAYHESLATMVDNYATYANVMNTLFGLVKVAKAGSFPGFSNYVPVNKAMIAEPKSNRRAGQTNVPNLRECCVRRKSDGTKYVLVYDGAAIFLVPRHMRCVFLVSNDAWLGSPLSGGKFVLEGELVRLSKERHKEKLITTDILAWCDKGSATNVVARSTWMERQERLKTQLCNESTAFFPKGDMVIVHQNYERFATAFKLLEVGEYPTEGLVFVNPVSSKREDAQYLWRPPESITVDFRLGTVVTRTDTSITFTLEVFDQRVARYVQFNQDTVEVPLPRPFAIEGAVAICGLDPTNLPVAAGGAATSPSWVFHRTRSDVTISAFKDKVDELLVDALITKAEIVGFLAPQDSDAPAAASPAAVVSPAVVAPSPSYHSAPTPTAGASTARGAFGSALGSGEKPAAASRSTPSNAADLLRQVVDSRVIRTEQKTAPAGASAAAGSDVTALQSMIPHTRVVGDGKHATESAEGANRRANTGERKERQPRVARDEEESHLRKCRQCSAEVEEHEGQVDDRDRRFYCFKCWDELGYNICAQCKNFAKGKRDTASTRGRSAPFYCDGCWATYEAAQKRSARSEKSSAKGTEKKGDAATKGNRRGGRKTDTPAEEGANKQSAEEGASTSAPSTEAAPSSPASAEATEAPKETAVAVTA